MKGGSMKVGESFKPDKAWMKLCYMYLLFVDVLVIGFVILPVAVVMLLIQLSSLTVLMTLVFLIVPFIAFVLAVAFWISMYYESINYELTEAEINVQRGVWWKHMNTVPYNRVTNIDVVQGPLSRRFGLAKIKVQTAGYSATGGGASSAEAQLTGIRNYNEIRELILSKARGVRPVAVEAAAETSTYEGATRQMLDELKRIRKILEKQERAK
jgi:membrane protein YdbS with pleckstrin-like domain